MRFEVPQYIDVEDKIFGPLSWRQFLYVAGGVGLAVALFLAAPFIIFLLIGLPIGLVAAALAFYPINNRPFSFFLEAVYNYYRNSTLYLWKPNVDAVHRERGQRRLEIREANISNAASGRLGGSASISSLARRLELEVIKKDNT